MDIKSFFFKNAFLIDGNGNPPLKNGELLITGKRIVGVGEKGSIDVPKSAKIIDLDNKTLMPGLSDAHLHLHGSRDGDPALSRFHLRWDYRKAVRAAKDAETLINAGYTACRDAGGAIALGLRDAINEGTLNGPRIMAAGRSINSTFGHVGREAIPTKYFEPDTYADGVDECIKAVRIRLREGSDFIKIATGLWGESKTYREVGCIPSFTLEEIKAMNKEAESLGFFVMTHANGYEGIKNALDAGVFSIEHGGNHTDEARDKELFQLMIKKNAMWAPTTAIIWKSFDYAKRIYGWSEEETKKFNENLFWALRTANKMGVRMASSSDYSGSGNIGGGAMGTNAFDLELLVRAGIPEMDAIIQATKRGAEAMKMEKDLGTLEKGKLADFIIVKGNPLEDIKVLQDIPRIKMVWKDGKLVVKRT